MNEKLKPEVSPVKNHIRQAAWQIWLPFVIGLLVFLGLAILAGFAVFGGLSAGANWAALSVIFWITPSCLGGLLGLALAVGSVVITAKALANLPDAGGKLITGIKKIQTQVENFSNKVSGPVIASGSQKAGWDRFWELIRKKE